MNKDIRPSKVAAQIITEIQESIDVKVRLQSSSAETIDRMARIIGEGLLSGKKLIAFGNGGSAADAQHIVAEFVGRYQIERKGLAAMALAANLPVLTAVGNDYGFGEIFARQIEALGCRGDVVLALSTSGNSANVLKGLETARQNGLRTLGLSGRSGGKMMGLADVCLCVASDSVPRIQEAHMLVGHILCGLVERLVIGENSELRQSAVSVS